ncbi:MAG: hypothetical protein Q8N51_03055, partial [Gammaproteobacteria bacterium]|nr:hypothetical protein [Gammaproteobacteria bacterium]
NISTAANPIVISFFIFFLLLLLPTRFPFSPAGDEPCRTILPAVRKSLAPPTVLQPEQPFPASPSPPRCVLSLACFCFLKISHFFIHR